ncbi:MAG: hypothetical protein U0230_23455 [Polyangiales bacterium]
MERDRQPVLRDVENLPLRSILPDRLAIAGWAAALLLFGGVLFTQSGWQQDDPYHLALVELMLRGEVPAALPWAKHTVLATRFSDLHFGFHVTLAPLVALLGADAGGRAGTVVGMAALLLVVVRSAGRASPLRAVLPALLVASSGVFLLRAMGMRPLAWGAAAILATLPLALGGRHRLLALVGALFAFGYAAFPLLALPLAAHCVAHAVTRRSIPWKPTASVLAGVAVGLLLHPHPLEHLDVLAVQLFDVSLDRSGLNLEYEPPGLAAILREEWLVLALLSVAGAYAARAWRSVPGAREELLAYALLAALAFLLLLRNTRGVDTFVPAVLALLAVASRLAPREFPPGRGPIALAAVVAIGGGLFHLREAWSTSRSFEAIDARAAATWLERNSRPGDEVFLPDYGAFPRLFYSDRRNVYTLGLDPAFLRALDPELYRRYLEAVRLERDPYPLVARTLGARYVYVENTTNGRPFHAYLVARRDRYRPVYQDAFASVFEVRPPMPSSGSPAR